MMDLGRDILEEFSERAAVSFAWILSFEGDGLRTDSHSTHDHAFAGFGKCRHCGKSFPVTTKCKQRSYCGRACGAHAHKYTKGPNE